MTLKGKVAALFCVLLVLLQNFSPVLGAQTSACDRSSTGLIPLMDMGANQFYKGQEGGLFGAGQNMPPSSHDLLAQKAAALVTPRDGDGTPAETGKIGLVAIGMSNTRREFDEFIPLAVADPDKNPAVILVNAAQGAKTAFVWASTEEPWILMADLVAAAGLTHQQVQVVWLKQANANPSGDDMVYAATLQTQLAEIVKKIKIQYPNVALVYLSSRVYGGYATKPLNPEPYAYSSAFAVRSLIQEQIDGGVIDYHNAPVLVWGPYLWADGLSPRSDGLIWECSDFEADGTHPVGTGLEKVAGMLLDYFKTSPYTQNWFTALPKHPAVLFMPLVLTMGSSPSVEPMPFPAPVTSPPTPPALPQALSPLSLSFSAPHLEFRD